VRSDEGHSRGAYAVDPGSQCHQLNFKLISFVQSLHQSTDSAFLGSIHEKLRC
jgi:hypothetical protein